MKRTGTPLAMMVAAAPTPLKDTAQAVFFRGGGMCCRWHGTRLAKLLSERATFFEGLGVDALYMHFHKANEFLGITQLPTFICNDIVKNPQVEQYLADYTAHLNKVFGRA